MMLIKTMESPKRILFIFFTDRPVNRTMRFGALLSQPFFALVANGDNIIDYSVLQTNAAFSKGQETLYNFHKLHIEGQVFPCQRMVGI